jgi:beta-galactosidase
MMQEPGGRDSRRPDWVFEHEGVHEDSHRMSFVSRHAHRPTRPILDLIVSDVLSILFPAHRWALYCKFFVVAAGLILAEGYVLSRIRDSSPQSSTALPVTLSLVLMECIFAWILHYRRTIFLFVDSLLFKQPSWWMDPTVPAVHRLPMHTTIRLFSSEAQARRAACFPQLATRDTVIEGRTPHVWNIDKQPWTFRLYNTVQDALEAVTQGTHHQHDEEDSKGLPDTPIRVPGNWMLQGFRDRPIYTNIKYPFPCEPPIVPHENPTGRYCVKLDLPSSWVDQLNQAVVTLLLHGIESAVYVYMNDKLVGFSKDSRLPCEFDVTAEIRPIDNTLQLVVVRWSDGSYVEDQDHWWMAGIHRSVELVLRPKDADILDYRVQADADGRLTCLVECRNEGKAIQSNRTIVWSLYDDNHTDADGLQWTQGRCIYSSKEEPVQGNFAQLSSVVNAPRLWTAETPFLYTLTTSLLVNGNITQVESSRVGFRSGAIVNGQYLVNGKAITVCGLNRHEHDPDHGKVVKLSRMKQDIVLLKQNNFNAVRTSHYPNHPSFYKLCDFYGLYVCDEANIETHGMKPMGRLTHDPAWEGAFVSRVVRLVQRDRNHACIMFWSLGNEAGRGRNLQKARDLIKRLDPSRPVCYESGGAFYEGIGRSELTDTVASMYPDVPLAIQLANRDDEDRPVILCEYSHAMGNSNGNLHLYWDAFWNNNIPRLQGGFIWDMIDQGLRKKTESGEAYFGYGGDFGDTCNDLQFCINGLFSPDRHPHPAVSEAKFLQQPVHLCSAYSKDNEPPTIHVSANLKATLHLNVTNRYSFINLSHLAWSWQLEWDGSMDPLYIGSFTLSEGSHVEIALDEAMSHVHRIEGMKENVYFVNIRGYLRSACSWAPAGHEIVTQQIKVAFVFLKPASRRFQPPVPVQAHLTTFEDEKGLGVTRVMTGNRQHSLAVVESASGSLCFVSADGSNLMAQGLYLNASRAATDNDQGGPDLQEGFGMNAVLGMLRGFDNFSYASRWKYAGLGQGIPQHTRCQRTELVVSDDRQKVDITSYCDVRSSIRNTLLFRTKMAYGVHCDGSIEISCSVFPQPALKWLASLPRIGLNMQLDPSLFCVRYYGRGPGENYPDRKASAEMGVYQTTASEMGYLKYIYPVENGSRSDCQWIAFQRNNGSGLCIVSDSSFSCSALLHSATELDEAKHT